MMAMKDTTARLISNILNPFIVAIVVLALLIFHDASTTWEAVKWIMISITVSVLPVLIAVAVLVRLKKLDGFFSNPREQRYSVYWMASVLGVIDCVLFWCIKAPELLSILFTAGLIAVVIFAGINYCWKISLHTAFVTGAVVVLVIIFGWSALYAVVFVPLVGWSRIILRQHTSLQVIAGGLLSVVIITAIFWSFGVLS
jgi:membrane-associated phospholipid phosphatase